MYCRRVYLASHPYHDEEVASDSTLVGIVDSVLRLTILVSVVLLFWGRGFEPPTAYLTIPTTGPENAARDEARRR